MQKFELKLRRRDVSTEELLADIKATCIRLKQLSVTRVAYDQHGQFSTSAIVRRFGTWNKALALAGIVENNRYNIPDEELFENLASVWTRLGRQPFYSDLDKSGGASKFSVVTYSKRFGSWNKALVAFVRNMNGTKSDISPIDLEKSSASLATTKQGSRVINWRLRAFVLIRDNCICKMCGASPSKDPSVTLHVDHIYPWAKGGATVPENLQTLCATCNIGKSDEVFKVGI